jgi:hypothetical protein
MKKLLLLFLFAGSADAQQYATWPASSGSSGTVTSITAGTGLTGGTITSTGTIALAVPVTVPDGGTGDTTLTLNGILFGNGASAAGITAAGTTGQVLTATSGSAPTWQSPATTTSQNAATTTVLSTGATDLIVYCDSTSAAFSITLPQPSTNTNRRITIVDTTGQFNTNNVTIVRYGSESISGVAASYVIHSAWASLVLVSNGTNWFII